ncbi:hypothetical protein FEZ34_01690 [Lacticaseibacillus casei]|nr:hypothetical protein FEZ34_01690 [Lacticaseibacillus casei]
MASGPAPEGHNRWSLSLVAEHAKVFLEHPVKSGAIGHMLKKAGVVITDQTTRQSKIPNS